MDFINLNVCLDENKICVRVCEKVKKFFVGLFQEFFPDFFLNFFGAWPFGRAISQKKGTICFFQNNKFWPFFVFKAAARTVSNILLPFSFSSTFYKSALVLICARYINKLLGAMS